jgi:hypothetical protein
MKKNMSFGIVLLSAVLGLSLLGCDNGLFGGGGDDENNNQQQQSGVDFTSYNTSYSIKVRNGTSEKLVAFKGALSAETLIGGIPARANGHGLPKDSKLFNKSEDFPLILLTEEQYVNNKNNLKSLENSPFTRVFAFYNAQGTNENIYEISKRLGGSYTLIVQNPTDMNVELRLNGINGETIGYAAQGMLDTKLFLNHGDYTIFPVFKKYNALRDEIITVYPKGASGLPMTEQFAFDEEVHEYSVNAKKYLNSQSYSTGTAWLIIDNATEDTGVQLQKGGVIQRTSTGIATINRGAQRTFQVDMAKVGDQYAESANIGGYTVGPAIDPQNIGEYTLAVDKIYMVTITGSVNDGTLVVSAPVEQGAVNLDDFDTPAE